jgi:hypothetical protein
LWAERARRLAAHPYGTGTNERATATAIGCQPFRQLFGFAGGQGRTIHPGHPFRGGSINVLTGFALLHRHAFVHASTD